MSLKDKHTEYIARAKSNGARTMTYTTPCCKQSTEDRVPDDDSQWDSLCTCVHCGELYMKIATGDSIKGLMP